MPQDLAGVVGCRHHGHPWIGIVEVSTMGQDLDVKVPLLRDEGVDSMKASDRIELLLSIFYEGAFKASELD